LCKDFSLVLLWSSDPVQFSIFVLVSPAEAPFFGLLVPVSRLVQQGFVPPDLSC
jgi:hypothetical protein